MKSSCFATLYTTLDSSVRMELSVWRRGQMFGQPRQLEGNFIRDEEAVLLSSSLQVSLSCRQSRLQRLLSPSTASARRVWEATTVSCTSLTLANSPANLAVTMKQPHSHTCRAEGSMNVEMPSPTILEWYNLPTTASSLRRRSSRPSMGHQQVPVSRIYQAMPGIFRETPMHE